MAGDKRSLFEDYGYWYCPDGRNKAKQAEFEMVEVKPQAIEWALSVAAGFDFNVSVDNLNGEQTCRFDFQQRVHQQLLQLIKSGFNPRTTALLKALSDFYNTPWPLTATQFDGNTLRSLVMQFKLGLIVNPVAGLGGSVALKGSDGMAYQAIELGAEPKANLRTKAALEVLLPYKDLLSVYTVNDAMGEKRPKSSVSRLKLFITAIL